MRAALFIFSLVIFALGSCNEAPFYSSEYLLPEEGWSENEMARFNVDIDDTLATYDLTLDVSHSEYFEFQNLYIEIKTTFPDSLQVTDQLSLQFLNGLGQWIGRCSSGNCLISFNLQRGIKFLEPGRYTFEVGQFSRMRLLDKINSVNLVLYKNQ